MRRITPGGGLAFLAGIAAAAILCASCARAPVEQKEDVLSGLTLKLSGTPTLVCPKSENCSVRVSFSLDGSGDIRAKPINSDDIAVSVDGLTQQVSANDLRLTRGDPASIVVAMDLSNSMNETAGGAVPKIKAANEALKYFFENLSQGDRIGLVVFGARVAPVIPQSDSFDLPDLVLETNLQFAAEVAGLLEAKGGSTSLYQAIQTSIDAARRARARNVLIVTDGVDTVEFEGLNPGSSYQAKQQREAGIRDREQELTALARAQGIRVFTVGIGELGVPYADGWVDIDSLERISSATGAGGAGRIEVQSMQTARSTIAGALKEILVSVRESLHSDYELMIPLSEEFSRRNRADVTVDVLATPSNDERRSVTLRLAFRATLDGTVDIQIIPIPAVAAADASYWVIYASLLAVLALFSGVPVVIRGARKRRAEAFADAAVSRLGPRSPHIGAYCPNEARIGNRQDAFRTGDYAVECPQCHTPHHITCWLQNSNSCWRCKHELKLTASAIAHQDE